MMVLGRAVVLGPMLVVIAFRAPAPEAWFGVLLLAGLLSDIFDGILARRWRTETSALRIADSAADLVFYLCVLFAVVIRHWPVLRDRLPLLGALLALEAGRMLFDWAKYRRMASYHSYAAKAWGLLLAAATLALLCFNRGEWLVTCALIWGIICDLEGLIMSLLLPEWAHDVKTLRRAFVLRRQMLAKAEMQVP
jgi:CDP-diacylglycerol--glycerol-3-phosphate 3-phosphatidyltransferase